MDLHRSELSPNTVAKAYRCLSEAMDGAVDAGLVARSPCALKGAGTERHAEMQIAAPEQLNTELGHGQTAASAWTLTTRRR